jgi:hypothetical protein
VAEWIFLARTIETLKRELAEPEVAGIEFGVLSRADELRCKPAVNERSSDGSEFNGFRPRADHEPNICETQPSP